MIEVVIISKTTAEIKIRGSEVEFWGDIGYFKKVVPEDCRVYDPDKKVWKLSRIDEYAHMLIELQEALDEFNMQLPLWSDEDDI